MNTRTTLYRRLTTLRALDLCVYAAALACFGGLLVASGCGESSAGFDTVDVSEFQTFRFWLESAYGFCPRDNAILSASVVRTGADHYVLRLRRLVGGAGGYEDVRGFSEACPPPADLPPGVPSLQCEELPERDLTPIEINRMRELFREVVFLEGEDPACRVQVVDWCVIRYFDWDGFEVTNASLCNTYPRIMDKMDEIEAFLEGLR